MIRSRARILAIALFSTLFSAGRCIAQFGFDAPSKATVTAVADVRSIQPGQPFYAGIKIAIAPGWHTYWKNTGSDSGQPTNIKWDLPEGFVAGELLFPIPHYEVTQGFSSHVFSGTVYHIAQITPPADLAPGTEISLGGTVELLVCDDSSCEPPKARTISLKLPVDAAPPQPSPQAKAIGETLEDSPLRLPKWEAKAWLDGESVVIEAEIPDAVTVPDSGLYFFPDEHGVVTDGKDSQTFSVEGKRLTIKIAKGGGRFDGSISGLLTAEGGFQGSPAKAIVIATAEGAQAAPVIAEPALASEAVTSKPKGLALEDLSDTDKEEIRAAIQEIASWIKQESRPVLLMIVFAFIGGIILNLMPCVFPVLGVKIMGFVNQAGEDKAKIRGHGLVFAAGVLVSLWALVAALLILKHAGEKVGWGFQLQSPGFLAVMIIVLFAFALNLSGLFEFGTSLAAAGSNLQQKHGYSGSFFSGVLAVLVATPCTGPFMGPAIGFALTGTDFQTVAVFTALGLGLALPYVLLSFFPYLIQKLPKPGAWMEAFKQFMAFPLFATVIWLVGVFGKVTGLGAVTFLLFGLVTLAFGLWIFGRYATPFSPKKSRAIARFATLAIAAGAGWFTVQAVSAKHDSKDFGASSEKFGIAWQGFDPRKIVQERKKGRTIFIDFTADW